MAILTPQDVVRTGTVLTLSPASSGGDEFAAVGRTTLLVRNTSAAAVTVTVITSGTVLGLAVADMTVSVPAGAYVAIADLGHSVFKDMNQRVPITYSATAGVSVALLQPPQ